MTGSLILQVRDEVNVNKEMGSTIASNGTNWDKTDNFDNIKIATVVALLIGIYQLIFGIFRFGFISYYMSEQLISGFITSSSFYVLTSQIGYMTGVRISYRNGPLALYYIYEDFFRNIKDIHLTAVIMSGGCIAILLFFKLFFNDKIKQWTKINIPFPTELILVILSTFMSHFLDLKSSGIKTVGPIPTGLPLPSLPQWYLIKALWLRCIPLAIVAYAITYSTGKTFATKHNYEIDSNQELIAIGTTNTISSFFSCLPTAASLSRSAVQESVGGKTQMVSLVNCCGLLFVLLYFGAFLEKLPNVRNICRI
jgi:MFS superfamily sulfate permease-like transporter